MGLVPILTLVGLAAPHLRDGIATADAHAIMQTAQSWADRHALGVSRPPGHPVTEFWVFGLLASLLKATAGIAFDDKVYALCQLAAGVIGLGVFYEYLLRARVSPWRAMLAAFCLALSPVYLCQAMDGEEFIWAMLLSILALRFLIPGGGSDPGFQPVRAGSQAGRLCHDSAIRRLSIAALWLALAMGCRVEALFFLALFALPLAALGPRWRRGAVVIAMTLSLSTALLWIPVVFGAGIHPLYGAGMGWRQAIPGAGYKLLFQVFNPVEFAILFFVVAAGLVSMVRSRHADGRTELADIASVAVPSVYVALFFFYAAKPANFLPALPFVFHALARRRSAIALTAVAALSVMHCFVGVDIFTSRKLSAPHPVPGHFLQSIRQKPAAHAKRLAPLSRLTFSNPTILVTALWSWDLDYAVTHGIAGLQPASAVPGLHPGAGYRLPGLANTVLLPRNDCTNLGPLKECQVRGYRIGMERDLYREVYEKYEVLHATPERVERDGISLFLVVCPIND